MPSPKRRVPRQTPAASVKPSADAATPRKKTLDARAPKGGQLLARHLRQRIVSGALAEGDRLPLEPELMRQFGVSRTTLREALRILESEALIRVLRGSRSGPIVTRPDVRHSARYAGIVMQLEGATLADVWQARQTIEPSIARIVAQRRDPAVVRALREALAAEATALQHSQEAYARAGSYFHELLIRLSGNATLTVLTGTLNAIFERHMLAANLPDAPDQQLNSLAAHRTHTKLVDLIEAGDAAGAERLWTKHHVQAAHVILQGQGATTIADLHLD